MHVKFSLLALAGLVLLACELGNSQTVTGLSCGSERWPVKTLSDADAASVNLAAQPATIQALRALPTPSELPQNRRIRPTELETFMVTGRMVEFKLENDHDIHIVLADPNDPRATMIAEVVDVSCSGANQSSATARMKGARDSFRALFGEPQPSFRRAGDLVTITGVGFFDSVHGQTGVAPNGIELHPVLEIGRAATPPR